jgi:DNA (cytosine-5)-methyltransferase 1
MTPTTNPPVALDLFAGTGWGVACERLGITEYGAETMTEARETRRLNGFRTPFGDVADITEEQARWMCMDLLIASPPCQTFSVAGNGAGREALLRVLEGVSQVAAGRTFKPASGDPRTWLVLEPLRLVLAAMPPVTVWEQVPTVLAIWEACAEVLRDIGYSVWTGNLLAEQYGVPQTRKRAFLIARRDGCQALPPVPTHSRYYNRDPERLDDGVRPWVSMAEALGWGPDRRPSPTVTGGGTETGGAEPIAQWTRFVRSNYGTNGNARNRGERLVTVPAPTITSKAGRNQCVSPADNTMQRISIAEAAALQTFPAGFEFVGTKGRQYLQIGNAVPPLLGQAVLRAAMTKELSA